MVHDLRYGLRLMARRPGFAAVAVATLALGIGANTAIFAVVDRVLLRPVPYPDPSRLVVVWETSPSIPLPVMYASPPNLSEWQQRAKSFEHLGGFQWRNVTLGGAEPEQVRGARVTVGLMRALGVQPRLGRLFLDEEDRAGGRPVVIISDAFWRRKFDRNPFVVGQVMPIDGVQTEIVGVMPPGYVCPPAVVLRGSPPAEAAELWVPHATNLEAGQRGAHYLAVIGRLRPGVTVAGADREMNDVQVQIERAFPDYRDWRAHVAPLVETVTASSRRAVVLVASAVAFVLLLACANVANLLLARGVGRRREFAVRTALGAGRARLAVQVMLESTALALAGGAAGVALAAALVRIIVLLGPATMPGLQTVRLDLRATLFAVGASMLAAVLAGAIPAAGVARTRLADWLAERTGGGTPGAARAQQGLAVGQVGLAVALLVTAVMLVESFRQLRTVDPGFNPEHVVTGKVTLAAGRYPDAASRVSFVDRVVDRLRQMPGVIAAGTIDAVPIADNRQGSEFTRLDGPAADPTRAPTANVAWITEGYFEALGVAVIAGRTFTPRDAAGSPRVVVINRRLARQVFGDEPAIGRQVRIGNAGETPFEVIGVVGDERHVGMDTDPTPSFFLAYRQLSGLRDISLVMRLQGGGAPPPSALRSLLGPLAAAFSDAVARQNAAASLRTVVRGVDAELPLFQVRTMEQVVDAAVATPRSMAWLLSMMALSGLLLAAIGVFGVLSHAVGQRTREIGVRMAIGASPTGMLRMVLGEGLVQVGCGLVLGLILSIGLSRLLSGLLFGVDRFSPLPYLLVSAVIVFVSMVACLVPAWRAMRIDPAVALRTDH
jgi:putative ABC transport system permease protein